MRFFIAGCVILAGLLASAQQVSVKWEMSDPESLQTYSITGDSPYNTYIIPTFELGSKISKVETLAKSGALSGYEAVEYDPAFASFYVTTKTSGRTEGHNIEMTIVPTQGHTFKPTRVSFDAVRVGTDAGGIDVCIMQTGDDPTVLVSGLTPNRNRVDGANPDAFSHLEYAVNDLLVGEKGLTLKIYFHNINGVDNSSPKSLALRNLIVDGAVDEEIYNASHYLKSFTFVDDQGATIDLTNDLGELKNSETYTYPVKMAAAPQDFVVECADGYEATVQYEGNVAKVAILKNQTLIFDFEVRFVVREIVEKPEAKPLNRGLMAVSLDGAGMGTGNLVSWRHREADGYGVKYRLARGSSPEGPFSYMARGTFIKDRTNYSDTSGSADSYYKLDVYDANGVLLETEISGKTWDKQTLYIPISAPTDTRNGVLYNPNDASFCDMDGDGEYEIILKWSPSNEKDAASSGTTSNPILDCYKLDGTQLWRIDLGPNFFTSAHTIQFIAWDFDGDGYGELICKTGPGTIDGQGNYVVLGNDDPEANWLNGRGKQVEGPEYITVFDGMTGAELSTIPYHTSYADGASYWGDSNQNRSERYLAALAYLDGYDANPSPIFARGYYAGAFVGAYDWDGVQLKERWVSRNTTKSQGLYGEGAHWVSVGDCDGDGRQEIVYGSAALDHDGTLLYRTGLGHGDALHLGDFLTDREGLEVFMVHEASPYGYDLRDAATGELISRVTASGDTGRGLAAHFDSTQPNAQCLYSASPSMFNLDDGSVNGETWAIGQSGAGINNRIYWDGDLYDEFFDKSIIAHWNPEYKSFDRYKVNNTFYTSGTLNNVSKYNPCVLGDILGDWREEIITHDGSFEKNTNTVTASATHLIINATSFASEYRLPHLMDDPQYRVQVVNQNCCYNQPPHLSFDPAVKYAGNPNNADNKEIDGISDVELDEMLDGEPSIYTLQGIRIPQIKAPGLYIVNGKKLYVK